MDIDIDMKTDFNPLDVFPKWVKASNVIGGELKSHPCGIYPQHIPVDRLTGLAAIPYDKAEELGFMKLDFLHNSVYNHFESREEIEALIQIEPEWSILLMPSEQKKLFQLSKHGEILDRVKPKSIEDIADVLALIRPGKTQFLELYLSDKNKGRVLLYAKDKKSGYSFKKSHAIAYALVIVLQLHLIQGGIL